MRGRVDGGVSVAPSQCNRGGRILQNGPWSISSMQKTNLDSELFARSHEQHYREAPITKLKSSRYCESKSPKSSGDFANA